MRAPLGDKRAYEIRNALRNNEDGKSQGGIEERALPAFEFLGVPPRCHHLERRHEYHHDRDGPAHDDEVIRDTVDDLRNGRRLKGIVKGGASSAPAARRGLCERYEIYCELSHARE